MWENTTLGDQQQKERCVKENLERKGKKAELFSKEGMTPELVAYS